MDNGAKRVLIPVSTCTNRIDRKHVDFLLGDPKTAKPLLGIELDDRSHQRADRQERDEFVQKVFDAAQLPLVRLPVRRAYAIAELNALLRGSLDSNAAPSPGAPAALAAASPPVTLPAEPARPVPEPPRCPQCGSPMVLRTAGRGFNQGGQFWGCPNYPRCRGIVKHQA